MVAIRLLAILAALATAPLASASDVQTGNAKPVYVSAYLCQTPQYAIEFALTVARDGNEVAANNVSQKAGKTVCGLYGGLASVVESRTALSNGVTYKLTALKFHEDNSIAWDAVATDGQPAKP